MLATVLPPMPPVDPESDIGRLFEARGYVPDLARHRVFGTRSLAQRLASLLPDGPVTLDCSGVDVVTPPFFDELRSLRGDDLTFEHMNEDVEASLELVDERRAGR